MKHWVKEAASANGVDNPDIKNTIAKNKNSYLVQIGTDNKKYCYLYEPDAYQIEFDLSGRTIFSFGGSRRDIFEKTLLSLKVGKLIVGLSLREIKVVDNRFIRKHEKQDSDVCWCQEPIWQVERYAF